MTSRWLECRVLAYAHQGGAWEAPSSTLYAIRRAMELGATGLELDVHSTADGQLVVCHDPTVDRTTAGTGAISDLTLRELETLDNAYWWVEGADVSPGREDEEYIFRGRAPDDPDFAVATLAAVLELMNDYPEVVINLDIKRTEPVVAPYESLLADQLRSAGNTGRMIVASFLDQATDNFSAYAPEIATSAGTAATVAFYAAVQSGTRPPDMSHVALQVPARRGDVAVVDELFVEAAHDRGLAVHVWTVNDVAEMNRLLDLGVDGLISDRPSVLVDLLDRRQVSYRPERLSG